MFINTATQTIKSEAVTDVIKKEKRIIRYKSLLQILKTIHIKFLLRKKEVSSEV